MVGVRCPPSLESLAARYHLPGDERKEHQREQEDGLEREDGAQGREVGAEREDE